MATESYQVQLERVQAAIAKIETGGQTVIFGSRQITLGNIKWLYDREKRLLNLVAKENGTYKRSRSYRLTQL